VLIAVENHFRNTFLDMASILFSNIDWKVNMPEKCQIFPAFADFIADCNESFWLKPTPLQTEMERGMLT